MKRIQKPCLGRGDLRPLKFQGENLENISLSYESYLEMCCKGKKDVANIFFFWEEVGVCVTVLK